MASDSDLKDAELFRALMTKNKSQVLNLCNQFPKGAFYRLTLHDDTVLHMALQSGQIELVLELLGNLPTQDIGNIKSCKNRAGITLLHQAATSNGLVEVAAEILRLNPDSLLELNEKSGERVLFRAVRYGQIKMFKFLDEEVIKKCPKEEDRVELFYQNNEWSILHQAIINGHFDLALWIAKRHGYLINTRDVYEMSGLQHLARNPSFKNKFNRCLKALIYSDNTNQRRTSVVEEGNTNEERTLVIEEGLTEQDGINIQEEEVEPCCYVPKWETMKKKIKRYESALELAKLLIAQDISWKNSESVEEVQTLGDPTKITNYEEKKKNIKETLTPLFLATKYGNVEIVREIFRVYPQAVEHIDEDGCTILHIAIKYGHIEVFDMVEELMEVPMKRLIKTVDKESNSILHMVGAKDAILAYVDHTESPALLLRRNLHLYERVKKISSAHFFNHLNLKGKTAKQVFAENNNKLREESKDWLKSTAQNCTIVAVLIATVAFAAAYTVPGGSKSDTGTPVLLHQTFFVVFTITDVLSLMFTLTSVVIFLSILTSPFRLKDFMNTLPRKLMLGVTFLIFSVSMMMLAFAATIILMIRNREDWIKLALYAVAFLPVSVFAISYMPLYLSLMDTLKYNLANICGFFPKFRFMGKIY